MPTSRLTIPPCLLAGLQFAWPFTLALLFLTNCVLLNLFPAILTTKFYGVLMAYVTARPHCCRLYDTSFSTSKQP